MQIDATRLSLDDGVVWLYLGEEVLSRTCLSVSVGQRLSQEHAALALQEGRQVWAAHGMTEPLVIHSDVGSAFTSAYSPDCCQEMGQWIRCRVNQVGEMGILERLHRTVKDAFVFRHEADGLDDLKQLAPQLQQGYNQERLHSSLGYMVPWYQLVADTTVPS